ncbi:hypothetical protein BGZ91_006119 [Linnemannia elongata]|nr:hypothetical protein BGZ91_006119 [Linnemannia elongata]
MTEHIAELCIQKLQHPSSGRHNTLLRQVQLTCMLHRIRMQAFLRPVMAGYHHHHQQQQQQQQQQLLLQQQQQQQEEHMQLQLQQEQQHLQEQQAFDQEMASHSEYDQQQASSGYDWSQDSSSASALSLDMLLSLGSTSTAAGPMTIASQSQSSNGSVTGSALTSIPDPTMSDFYSSLQQQQQQLQQQQQHYHSLSLSSIPLVSYAEDYSSSSSSPSANAASSLVLSSQQPSTSSTSHLPQQTYYELLMAANPNEPLSQLLSTSAATMTSTCFTATSSSSIPTPVISSTSSALPLDHSSTYTPIDSIPSVPASPLSPATASSMVGAEAPTAEQILTSVASAYSMAGFPLGPTMDAQHQQQQHHQQQPQTVPLTTKEIMDALSGQFPIQPVMTSSVIEVTPSTIASVIPSATTTAAASTIAPTTAVPNDIDASESTENVIVATVSSSESKDTKDLSHAEVATTTAVDSGTVSEWNSVATDVTTMSLPGEPSESIPVVNVGLRHDQQQQDETWDSDADVLSPPSLVYAHDTDDEGSSPTTSHSCATSPPAQVDLEMSEMTLTSPPLSPSRGPRMIRRSKSLAAGGLTGQSADNGQTASQRRKSRRISRRYQNVSESSSFGSRLDTLESELEEQYDLDSQQHQGHHKQQQQSQQVAAMPPKRRRPSDDDVSESPCSSPESSPPSPRTPPPSSGLPPITATHDGDLTHHGEVVVAHAIDHELDPSKRFKAEEVRIGVEGEDAGVLSPLPLSRSPKRQSSRLLRRTSGRA